MIPMAVRLATESTVSSDKRLFFGNDFGTGETAFKFLSNHNFHEANLIVWQPSTVYRELHSAQQVQAAASSQAIQTLSSRLAHLSDWLREGNTLILIGHAPITYRYKRSPSPSILSAPLEGHPPLDKIDFRIASGTRVECCGPVSTSDLLKGHIPLLKYNVVISGEGLVPFLRVALGGRGDAQIVGGYRRYGDGLIIYLPMVSGAAEQTAAFINDASRLPAALASSPSEVPQWVDQYQSVNDKALFAKVDVLTSQVNELQNELSVQQGLIQNSRDLKKLIFDTGTQFAAAVAEALGELGLAVVEGPHHRADLLGSNGKRFAAIEAKGVEGTTKEKDVREVGQWMAEVNSAMADDGEEHDPDLMVYASQLAKLPIERDGSDCKGILVMGTYRKLPLSERVQPSFPEPVVRVMERADVCALTGAQLLGLVLQARENPSLMPVILKELFETRGVFPRASDWNEFLANAAAEQGG